MNWLTKIKVFGDKIKRNLKKNFHQKKKLKILSGKQKIAVILGQFLKKIFKKIFINVPIASPLFPCLHLKGFRTCLEKIIMKF